MDSAEHELLLQVPATTRFRMTSDRLLINDCESAAARANCDDHVARFLAELQFDV
jgi:hypothetical protein